MGRIFRNKSRFGAYGTGANAQGQINECRDVRTLTVYDFDALRPHLAAWDRLAWNSPQMIPSLSPGWAEAFLRHYVKPTERWCCSFAYAGDELIGVLPLVIGRHRLLGARRPMLRTLYDGDTFSGDIPLAPDRAAAALRALLTQVRAEIPTHIGINMTRVRRSSPLAAALQQSLGDYVLCMGGVSRGSVIRLADSPGERTVPLSKNLRHNLRRARKRLDGKGAVSVDIRHGFSATPDFLPEFLAIEASGWKGKAGTAIASNPMASAFYRAFVESFCARGRLEWHILRVDGRAIAAGMGLRCGASLMLPKIGYDEDYADCDPGNILTDEVIKSVLARRDIAEINHISDQKWHRLWHMDQDDYIDASLIRRNGVSILFQLLPKRLKRTIENARSRRTGTSSPQSEAPARRTSDSDNMS